MTKKKERYLLLVRLCAYARLIFGPTIFLYPLLTSIISFMLDWIDSELYKRAGYAYAKYSFYDKWLDLYWYVWIMLYILFNNLQYSWLFVFLFLYRGLGQLLYFFSKKELLFFIFPNIFEIFFLYYLFAQSIHSKRLLSLEVVPFVLVGIIILVLIREYIAHLKKLNLSGTFTGKTTYWPRLNTNNYRIFGFVILLIIFLSTMAFFQWQTTPSYYSLAKNSTNNGSIILYDQQGSIIGKSSVPHAGKFMVFVFSDQRKNSALCQGEGFSMLTKSDEKDQLFFTFQKECIAHLSDGEYRVFLVDSGYSTIQLPFILKNENIVR